MRIEGTINVDPPSVGFGPVAPGNLQGNAAALRLTNSGAIRGGTAKVKSK